MVPVCTSESDVHTDLDVHNHGPQGRRRLCILCTGTSTGMGMVPFKGHQSGSPPFPDPMLGKCGFPWDGDAVDFGSGTTKELSGRIRGGLSPGRVPLSKPLPD